MTGGLKDTQDKGAASSRGPGVPLVPLLIAVVLSLAAYFPIHDSLAANAPLGAGLPPLPPPLYRTEGVKANQASVLDGSMSPEQLSVLAAQPDGVPPLRYPYNSEFGDFSISYPTGTQTLVYGADTFLKDGVESQSTVLFNQALQNIKVSILPRRDKNEKVTTFVSRMRSELSREGAQFYPQQEPLELPTYRFEHFEHRRTVEGTERSNFTYVGPYGQYVVVFQFITTPELHEKCRPYAEKIMRSFIPGWKSKKAMLIEDPAYGELAGKLPLTEEGAAGEQKSAPASQQH